MSTYRFFGAIAAIALTGALASCGNRQEGAKPATQVAVRVNGSEISVHQVNAVLGGAPALSPEEAAKLKKEVVDRLVNQQLAIDQAIEKKLDRNPDVVLSIERARREILARAYLESLAAAQPKPSPDEIRKYYDEHPALFANRRVFQMQELLTNAGPGIADALKPLVAAGKSLDEMAAWLKARNIAFRSSDEVRAAEQLPLELLPKLAELKDGQSLLVERPQGILVMRIATARPAAVDEAAATPRIQQFLANERAQKATHAEIQRLRAAARIEYQGEFASLAAAPESGKTPAPDSGAAPTVPGLEKGAAGLE